MEGAEETDAPSDTVFLQAIAQAGARITTTNELTVFKFNTVWRRDSYKLRPTHEQEAMLARIESGRDFRVEELMGALRSVVADKFIRIEMPDHQQSYRETHLRYRRSPGLEAPFAPDQLHAVVAPQKFFLRGSTAPSSGTLMSSTRRSDRSAGAGRSCVLR